MTEREAIVAWLRRYQRVLEAGKEAARNNKTDFVGMAGAVSAIRHAINLIERGDYIKETEDEQ